MKETKKEEHWILSSAAKMFLALLAEPPCPEFCYHTVTRGSSPQGGDTEHCCCFSHQLLLRGSAAKHTPSSEASFPFLFPNVFSLMECEINGTDLKNGLSGVTESGQSWFNNGPVWLNVKSFLTLKWLWGRSRFTNVLLSPKPSSESQQRRDGMRLPAQSLLVGPPHNSADLPRIMMWNAGQYQNTRIQMKSTERELWSFWPYNPPSGRKNCSEPRKIILTCGLTAGFIWSDKVTFTYARWGWEHRRKYKECKQEITPASPNRLNEWIYDNGIMISFFFF